MGMLPGRLETKLLLGALSLVGATSAAIADTSLSDLKKQLDALHERATKLETRGPETRRRASPAAAVEPGEKPTSIKIPGTNTSLQVGGFVRGDFIWDLAADGVGLDTVNAALTRAGIGIGAYAPNRTAFGLSTNCTGTLAPLCEPAATRTNNRLNGGNFRFHARLSRFWFKTWTPTEFGELYTHIATDFLNTNEAGSGLLRLRQAYGSLGPFTAGFLESNFRPTFAESETLDFGGTVGYAAVRRAQIRYTHAFGPNTRISISAEDPSDQIGDADIAYSQELNAAGTGPRTTAQRMPDFIATGSHRFADGQIWVSGIIRLIEHDTGGEPYAAQLATGAITTPIQPPGTDQKLGWGVAVAGTYDVTPRIGFGAHGFIGRGIGSYVGAQGDNAGSIAGGGRSTFTLIGITALFGSFLTPASAFHDAVIIGPGQIRAILSYGGFVWARYQFTDTMRANVAFGYAKQEIKKALSNSRGGEDGVFVFSEAFNNSNKKRFLTGTVDHMYSIHGNVIWSPVPQVDFGIEYVHLFVARFKGDHPIYVFANDRNGLISRVLGMMMYRF
jgi:hypothetical protein